MKLNENDKRYLCKYQARNMILIHKGEKIELDATNMLGFEYMNDYEFNLRSIFKVVLRLDIRKKLWILKNKKDITCKMEFNKIGMDIDTERFITASEKIWNDEFAIYLTEEDEAIDTSILEKRIQLNEGNNFIPNDITTENLYESQNLITLYLFNKKLLDASNCIYNEVYKENIAQQFVGRILTATKHHKVLMSKCENDEMYKEMLIPALPAYKAILYLDQYYGLYKKGAMLFYDMDILYLLNSSGDKVTAKRKDEWTETVFLVSYLDESAPGNGMIRKEGEKVNYVSLTDFDVNTERFSEIKNDTYGSESKMVITDDIKIDTIEADQSYIKQRNDSILYSRKGNNKFTNSIIKARMEENDILLYITAENIDITALTPNKIFKIVFDDPSKQKRFGKEKYKITYAYHNFIIESEGYMTASSQVCLKRCSK